MRNNINHEAITDPLLSWYKRNKREMPWRNTSDPYKIWLAEVILQQTRVEQGLPYYLKFIQKYPSIKHLSEAKIDEVLRLWQGLGYYSRARNLHKCAKTVSNEFRGLFPQEKKDLLKLPGIGPYTAAAIASFAFDKKEAVVDGNVLRVVTRLLGIADDIGDQKTIKKISEIVNSIIPSDAPADFNHAMMEFGATYCVPRNPNCENCIFNKICEANAKSLQAVLPVKKKKIIKKTRYFHYLIIQAGDKFLMRKRIGNDIWHGLFEFYLIETKFPAEFDQLNLPQIFVTNHDQWELKEESKVYKHILTHQNIMCRFYQISLKSSQAFLKASSDDYRFYVRNEIEQLPKPILIDNYLGEKII